MILFKKVTYSNFLAVGNTPISIDLNSTSTTLIVGSNGAGKSTIIEAIIFALFNKSFRKVNKNQLINSVNEKDCKVELEFSIGSKEYKIIRGLKPNIFDIYVDGNPLDQLAANSDQQKYLEQNILKLNYKSFTQIVILGSSTFVPFMQLPAAHRREIIEDLLDIRIFSTMNVILKDRIKTNNEMIKTFENEIEFLKEKVKMQKNHIDYISNQSQKSIEDKQTQIKDYEFQILECNTQYDSICEQLDEKNKELANIPKVNIKDLEKYKTKFLTKLSDYQNNKEFYNENDTCPTCQQDLTAEVKTKHITKCNSQIEKLEQSIQEVEAKIEESQSIIDKSQKILSEINELTIQMASQNYKCKGLVKFIDSLKEEIGKISESDKDIAVEKQKLTSLASEGVTLKKKLDKMKLNKNNYEVVSSLLKDTGIKSKIIKKYLPVMNQLINKYLQLMDFYVNFNLDENFEETIKSRFRDDFSYTSFSEGEKMRIDLALMFTWRAIAKLKNSANTNLLILDEVFDSSLDISGTEDFLRIIRGGIDDGSNIFVISHKGDLLHDKFERVLKFEKVKNFSKVKEI
jgi:DNA repair exonuclease SbcCD ATPase subunit